MERLTNERPSGFSGNMLRFWGVLLLLAGIIGRGILQTRILGIGINTAQQLEALLESNPDSLAILTTAVVLQAIESCAVPIFAFLLVEGFQHTKDWKKYALRLAGVAVLSELPYNLISNGNVLDLSTRNPAFGLLLGVAVLYFCQRYEEKSAKNIFLQLCVIVAALLWAWMLQVEHGIFFVVSVSVLWSLRNKTALRTLVGAGVGTACMLISPFYLASAIAFLPIHLYNGEQGNGNRWVNYLAYPILLLIVGVFGLLAF